MGTQFRIFVGPRFQPENSAYFYDWSTLGTGSTVDLSAIATTLSSTLTSEATTMPLLYAAAFPSKGGVWVGPNGSGQGWEYIAYSGKSSNTLTGAVRGAYREFNGVHNAGASVRQWLEIDSNDGRFHVAWSMNELWSAISWSGEIGGVNFPASVLRNNHLIVIQNQVNAGSWAIEYVGFLDSPNAKDDWQALGEWSARFVSSAELIAKIPTAETRTGELDMALHGSAESSQTLVGTYKERPSGDFTKANPDFGPDSAIDDDQESIWIAERLVGSNGNPPYNGDDPENFGSIRFSGAFINPPSGFPSGSRWIELTLIYSSFAGQSLWSANGGDAVGWIIPAASVEPGGRIILAEDESVYSSQNPLSSADVIFENRDFFEHLRPEGGELWLRVGELNLWFSRMRWGDGYSGVIHEDAPDRDWDGPTITAPGSGQTMRYIFNPSPYPYPDYAASHWQTGMLQNFGYTIYTDKDCPWIKITLSSMALKLHQDITGTVPGIGEKLYIDDDSGPSTAALSSSGKVKVGDEVIYYSARGDDGVIVSQRGGDSTIATVHRAEDEVYIIEPLTGVATDAPPIKEISWHRYNGLIYPNAFELWVSYAIEARTPEDEEWRNDYILVENVTGHLTSSYTKALATQRIKHIVFRWYGMTTDPARPRINRIKALADPTYYGAAWSESGGTVFDLIAMILGNAGIPGGAIIDNTSDESAPDGVTESGDAWTIIADFAEYMSHMVFCQKDSKVWISPFAAITAGSYTPEETWTRDNAASIDFVRGNTEGKSQVKLSWKSVDGALEGEEVYPTDPVTFGTVNEIGPYVYPNASVAQQAARRRFYQSRYPHTMVVECAQGNPNIYPSEIHRIQWAFIDGATIDSKYIVTGVDHLLENLEWKTVLTMREIGREGE